MSTVLVVDDEAEMVELVSMVLEDGEVDVLTANDGEQALEIVREEHPDLVLTDVMMPRMGGLELTDLMLRDPDTCDIIVLLMTAGRLPPWDTTGAAGMIQKPFDIGDLVETVHRHLGSAA